MGRLRHTTIIMQYSNMNKFLGMGGVGCDLTLRAVVAHKGKDSDPCLVSGGAWFESIAIPILLCRDHEAGYLDTTTERLFAVFLLERTTSHICLAEMYECSSSPDQHEQSRPVRLS